MYFKDKIDTDIDDEFESKHKFNINFKNININIDKKSILIFGVCFLLIIIGIILMNIKNRESYFIELSGDDLIMIYKDNDFIDPGYSARNNKGVDLTNKVVVNSNVNTEVLGDYEVIYTLGETKKIRYVSVIEKPVGATSIYLSGDLTVYLRIGDTYKEPGYTVVDSIDSNLTDKVIVNNKLDTTKEGIYRITYMVTNSTGITTQALRTVIVMGSNISLSLDNEKITNKEVGINIYIIDNYFDYLVLPTGTKITDKKYTYKVSDNGEYKFLIYDKLGKSTEETIKVNNIDSVSPTGSCQGTYGTGKTILNINTSDNSGISKYSVNGKYYTSNKITIAKDLSSVLVSVYDKAGNSTNITCSMTKEVPKPSSSSSKSSSLKSSSSSKKSSSSSAKSNPSVSESSASYKPTGVGGKMTGTKKTIVFADFASCTVYYRGNEIKKSDRIDSGLYDDLGAAYKELCRYSKKNSSFYPRIQTAGAYASKGGAHTEGRAVDLNNLWSYTANGTTYKPYSSQGIAAFNKYTKFICEVCNGKEDCKYNVNYQLYKNVLQNRGWCWGGNWGSSIFDPMHFEYPTNGKCGYIAKTFNC